MEPLVVATRTARVQTLTLNRPDKRNALSPDLMAALRQALQAAAADAAVGAIVLTGAGDKAFCAGGDLGPPSGDGFLAMHAARGAFAALLQQVQSCPKPIVGAAQGQALAGGLGLLLMCDWVVVAARAKFGTPEIKRGLFPMMILAVLLRTLGRRRTLQLSLSGQPIDGSTLERWGGCNSAVAAAAVLPEAQATAAHLASLSPAILALGKQALVQAEDMGWAQQLEYLRSQLSLNSLAEDAAIGVGAFFQKTEPQWVGR